MSPLCCAACVLTRCCLLPQNAGDNWTGANNPFGPKIPLGAHGAFGSAPPTASGWSSGECNFNGQAQCGQVYFCSCATACVPDLALTVCLHPAPQGPAPKVFVGNSNPYGVAAPPASGVGSGIPWYTDAAPSACCSSLSLSGADVALLVFRVQAC